MKTKFGTALALAAVLLTGTAAAAINTQALNSPTGSTLGTAGAILLPVDQGVAAVPGQTQAGTVSPAQTTTNTETGSTAPSVDQQSLTQIPVATSPTSSPLPTSITGAPISPSVVYGNPNPSNGEEEDDDEEDDDDEDDDDDDDDDEEDDD